MLLPNDFKLLHCKLTIDGVKNRMSDYAQSGSMTKREHDLFDVILSMVVANDRIKTQNDVFNYTRRLPMGNRSVVNVQTFLNNFKANTPTERELWSIAKDLCSIFANDPKVRTKNNKSKSK